MDQTPMNDPMDDDQPLYLPEELEREHLAEARRAVANSRGSRALAGRIASSALPRGGPRVRRQVRIAAWMHAVAAVLVIVIAAVTSTWTIGLAMSGLIAISLGAVVWVLHVIARNGATSPSESDPSRPDPRHRN